ncbi:TonB-dependent receptor [Teredinibacter waterburyi]|uniref:TonB-dependent receptor n=1 Tax=Teredinibacter waterburyi TaxID=1500538 RepID=UPI00165FEE74|nr:TonB-dependent receptor [Teredinibacter waterburyi]
MKYVGKRYADYGKAFYLDWYSSYNLGAQYQFNLLEAKPLLRVSVKNLFDTDYYTAIVGDVRVLGTRFVVKYIGNDVLVTVEEGRVMLLDQSSNAVVAELNRYFPEDIRLATTSKTPPQITAVIKLTDLASTVASLEAALNLDAYYDAENNVVLQQK